MRWNKWGSTPHLYTYRPNWVRRTWGWWDEWGVTALQTQDSKLSPVGLRPSTLTLGHAGCPQYSIFTIEQGGNILFLWNLNARAGDECAISDFPSRHQDPPPPALRYCYYIYTNTLHSCKTAVKQHWLKVSFLQGTPATRYPDTMFQCWKSVIDDGTTFNQHWVSATKKRQWHQRKGSIYLIYKWTNTAFWQRYGRKRRDAS